MIFTKRGWLLCVGTMSRYLRICTRIHTQLLSHTMNSPPNEKIREKLLAHCHRVHRHHLSVRNHPATNNSIRITMGADIHSFAEVRENGKWKKVGKVFNGYNNSKTDCPFDWRSYSMFGFLADVRNYSKSPVICEPKGLPKDSEHLNADYHGEPYRDWIMDGDHSHTYLTLKELTEYDYNQEFEDLRLNGGETGEPGEGEKTTIRDFLEEGFFDDIEVLKTLGSSDDVRVVFWFDN